MSGEENKALTAKQQLFADEYLIDLNATQAAKRAGYSEKTANEQGCRLLANVNIRAYIDAKMQKRKEKVALSAEWVVEQLISVSQKSLQAEPVEKWNAETRQLELSGEYKFDSNGANRALELLGKHLGMFKDKIEHSGEMSFTINRKRLSNHADSED